MERACPRPPPDVTFPFANNSAVCFVLFFIIRYIIKSIKILLTFSCETRLYLYVISYFIV
nr:MAG TPA: hypothetical protein [Caudoviricetes sp.]